jgi:hypothetical protein
MNPHGTDGNFTGNLRDNDPCWTDAFKKQVGSYALQDDEVVFMDIIDFCLSMDELYINYFDPTWVSNTH